MSLLNQDWEVKALDDLDPKGLEQVSDFFNTHFPNVFYPKCTPEIFEWKLGSTNPAGRGFLTVALSHGKVVGTASGTRKKLFENGQSFVGMEIGDTFTHPDFRKHGKCITPKTSTGIEDEYFTVSVFGRLVSETIARAQINDVKFVYGTPNENSRPPYLKRLKFKEISKGEIFSNVLITSKFLSPRSTRWLLSIYESITKLFAGFFSYATLGRNSISEISSDGFLKICEKGFYQNSPVSGKIYLENSYSILRHRYVEHPNYDYRFFLVSVKDDDVGVIVTTEILRPSGTLSFVISDWFFSEEGMNRNIELFISKMRKYNNSAATISFWNLGRHNSFRNFLLGIYPRRKVDVISKDFRDSIHPRNSDFGDFHIGWSDNG